QADRAGDVLAALGPLLPRRPALPSAEDLRKERGESGPGSLQVGDVESARRAGPEPAPLLSRGARGAVIELPVVLLPLLRLGENGVVLRDLLEAVLGAPVPGIQVGMELARQLPVGPLDVGEAGLAVDAQHFVVVHHESTFSLSGRGRAPGAFGRTTSRTPRCSRAVAASPSTGTGRRKARANVPYGRSTR